MKLPHRHRTLAFRILRSVICLAVVLSQGIAIAGFPVLVSASSAKKSDCSLAACGCSDEARRSNSCCCSPAKPVKRSCCQQQSEAKSTAAETKVLRWVAGVAAQKCKGDAPLVLQAGEPLVSAAAMSVSTDFGGTGSAIHPVSDAVPAFDLDPPIPPPRLV